VFWILQGVESIILDVSGPQANVPDEMESVEKNETLHNHTFIHLKNLRHDRRFNQSSVQVAERSGVDPVVLYVPLQDTGPEQKVMEIVSAFKDNEECHLVPGPDAHVFTIAAKQHAHVLTFAKLIERKQTFDLTLRCILSNNDGCDIKLKVNVF
jgi:hypothetical protein